MIKKGSWYKKEAASLFTIKHLRKLPEAMFSVNMEQIQKILGKNQNAPGQYSHTFTFILSKTNCF